MKEYTPINEFRLSKRGLEILKQCKTILKHNVTKVHVTSDDYKELLEGISPSIRHHCKEEIHLDGKVVVRK